MRDVARSVIGAIMVLAPRIMKGELDKLPAHHTSRGSAGSPRGQRDLETLQGRLATETGIGEDIICDFLHGIPGFTEQAVRDYLKQVKGTGAYARTIHVECSGADLHRGGRRHGRCAVAAGFCSNYRYGC